MATDTHLSIDQGSDVIIQFELKNPDESAKDLTNHTVYAWMKQGYSYDSSHATKFTSNVTDNSLGIIQLLLNNEQTDALDHRREYVFDVELHHLDNDLNNVVERILQGKITVNPSVTK